MKLQLHLWYVVQKMLNYLSTAFQPEPYNPEAPDVSRYNKFQEMSEQNRGSDDAILQYQTQSRSSLVSVPTIPNEKGGQYS